MSGGADAPCRGCAAQRRAGPLSEAELAALERTRLIGTRDGEPIILAVLLRRQGVQQFAGMSRPALCEWETPSFRCPWSKLSPAPILRHGPEVRAADGSYSTGPLPDEFHRQSHCPLYRHGYFVRLLRVPDLPRQRVDAA